MFYTVTLNPSLDLYMHPSSIALGETNRSRCESIRYGGKGINVAVILSRLGKDAVALGFAGGFTGEKLLSLLQMEEINADFVRTEGETRINVKLSESGVITEINAGGSIVTDQEKEQLFQKLARLQKEDILVLAGSAPPSFSEGYAALMQMLAPKGVRIAVDTVGETLKNALSLRPFVVKPNLSELEELLSRPVAESELLPAMREVQAMGAQNVLVSLGADGAALLDERGKFYREKAPKGKAVNTVGAGDSMLAAFLAFWEKGSEAALRAAVAVGSATAFSEGLAEKETLARICAE